jgi:hypothetical protein
MPNIPTVGVFIPNGYLNAGSFISPSGQGDPYGNIYPSGLTPGKVIELSPSEARGLAAPGTTLFDGAYQCILLDSGATQANAALGMAAYFRLDSGATVGALPETDYDNGSVTTYDQVTNETAAALFAGVFINPATLLGQSNTPVPGQYCFLWVGAGRATINVTSANNTPAVGDVVIPNGSSGSGFLTYNVASVTAAQLALQVGNMVTVPVTATPGVMYSRTLFYRISNQGV